MAPVYTSSIAATANANVQDAEQTGDSLNCPVCFKHFAPSAGNTLWCHINTDHISRHCFPPADFFALHSRLICSVSNAGGLVIPVFNTLVVSVKSLLDLTVEGPLLRLPWWVSSLSPPSLWGTLRDVGVRTPIVFPPTSLIEATLTVILLPLQLRRLRSYIYQIVISLWNHSWWILS